MIDSLKLIAVMGAGSVLAVRESAGRSGGVVLMKSELPGLLRGLSQPAMNYALAKYGLDEQALRLLWIDTQGELVRLSGEQGWPLVVGDVQTGLFAKAAVANAVVEPLSERFIAEFVGFPRATWRKYWAERFRELSRFLSGLEFEVQDCLPAY